MRFSNAVCQDGRKCEGVGRLYVTALHNIFQDVLRSKIETGGFPVSTCNAAGAVLAQGMTLMKEMMSIIF